MKKPRAKWLVYRTYYMRSEDIEDSFENEPELVGETWAVSEAQAINNVRHRTMGDYGTSQYKPLAVSGHWDCGYDWSAVQQ